LNRDAAFPGTPRLFNLRVDGVEKSLSRSDGLLCGLNPVDGALTSNQYEISLDLKFRDAYRARAVEG